MQYRNTLTVSSLVVVSLLVCACSQLQPFAVVRADVTADLPSESFSAPPIVQRPAFLETENYSVLRSYTQPNNFYVLPLRCDIAVATHDGKLAVAFLTASADEFLGAFCLSPDQAWLTEATKLIKDTGIGDPNVAFYPFYEPAITPISNAPVPAALTWTAVTAQAQSLTNAASFLVIARCSGVEEVKNLRFLIGQPRGLAMQVTAPVRVIRDGTETLEQMSIRLNVGNALVSSLTR